MSKLLVILPFFAVFAAVIYGAARVFGRIWLEHRLRIALLEKVEKKPELLDSVGELLDVFGPSLPRPIIGRQDYAVTGVILAALGAGSCVAGRILHSGKLAVGIYAGGWVCIALGVLLLTFGLIIRKLSRTPAFFPNRR